MSSSVNRIVRDTLRAEFPTAWDVKDAFIDQNLERMSNVELLKRISDAIEFAARDGRVVHHTTRFGGGGGVTGAAGAGLAGLADCVSQVWCGGCGGWCRVEYPKDDTQ